MLAQRRYRNQRRAWHNAASSNGAWGRETVSAKILVPIMLVFGLLSLSGCSRSTSNPEPARVAKTKGRDGREVALASRETYYSINQPIPNTTPPRRRFVSLRAMDDADIAATVHDVELYPPGRWFSPAGVDGLGRVECVLGEGIAKTFATDTARLTMKPGDTFELGDMTWVVSGIMRSEGKTFGSEIWCKKLVWIWHVIWV